MLETLLGFAVILVGTVLARPAAAAVSLVPVSATSKKYPSSTIELTMPSLRLGSLKIEPLMPKSLAVGVQLALPL
ncbi:MAG: hypothetical protein HY075_06260 [Deltaproteobacteria bacterium]|nr:hypothetical protein [Deltaproteobacteria bacterium]